MDNTLLIETKLPRADAEEAQRVAVVLVHGVHEAEPHRPPGLALEADERVATRQVAATWSTSIVCSICQMALRPLPRPSSPRKPRRELEASSAVTLPVSPVGAPCIVATARAGRCGAVRPRVHELGIEPAVDHASSTARLRRTTSPSVAATAVASSVFFMPPPPCFSRSLRRPGCGRRRKLCVVFSAACSSIRNNDLQNGTTLMTLANGPRACQGCCGATTLLAPLFVGKSANSAA